MVGWKLPNHTNLVTHTANLYPSSCQGYDTKSGIQLLNGLLTKKKKRAVESTRIEDKITLQYCM